MASVSVVLHDAVHEEFVSEIFWVQLSENQAPTKLSCRWRYSNSSTSVDMAHYFHSLDLFVELEPTQDRSPPVVTGHEDVGGCRSSLHVSGTALEHIARKIQTANRTSEVATKVILVPRDGYLCRTDIIELRLRHSEYVDSVIPFSCPNGHFPQVSPSAQTLLALLSSSPAAILLKCRPTVNHEAFELLHQDMKNRFSFPWVLPTAPPKLRPRVALVGGRVLYDMRRDSWGLKGPVMAAEALGIDLIVLDQPGHWLEGEEYSHLRAEFVAFDASDDAKTPENIAAAVKDKEISGILTFSDEYVIATAKAAEILGLPTESAHAIVQAHYKDETRKLLASSDIQILRLENAKELDDPSLHINEKLEALQFPLIVKPCRGGASRGVRKVQDHSGLREAIKTMEADGLAKHGILLETYVDGPEVDANLVLWDKELLFFEISDDFPCQADAENATVADNFVETNMVLPTRLPPQEVTLLGSSLHQSLLKLGFRTGVFHVEARVKNSSMRYTETDGILDLQDAPAPENGHRPDVFLIEVNARPPGFDCTFSTLDTYGVDFCALSFLQSIGDRERFAVLSMPFANGPQYWCGNPQVPIHRENVFVPYDFFDQVLAQLPEVAPYVSRAELFTQPGNTVSPRGGVGFIAYFLVYSRKSRRHLLEMSARIQDVSRMVLDGV